jgi:uncharacterized ion transporter superfamily protein YfcC
VSGLKFRVPHTLALLFFLMVVALAATWVVPQGSFSTEVVDGRQVVLPGTFETAPERTFLSPWELFRAVPRAFADAQNIIFFLFIIGGVLALIRATGAIDALLGRLLEKMGGRPGVLIFMVIFVFALTSSAMGASAEYIPFVLILVALCRAMGMDPMTAVGMIVAGYGIGYGSASFNQYTVVVAQGIADIPIYSGWQVRMAMLFPFVAVGAHHVWKYGKGVQADPSSGLLHDIPAPDAGEPPREYPPVSGTHIAVAVAFLGALVLAIWGIRNWGWYLTEMGAIFLILGVVVAILGRIGPSRGAERFVKGAMDLTETALLVGVARGIALIMEDGQILHTIVHGLSVPLSAVGPELAAVGMMLIQSVLNLFVPSGSGQAFVTMPIMAPLGDAVGVTRQVAVLAYQFGDGFSNMIIPTNAVLMGILGMAAVPYDRWFRFCLPLVLKLLALAALFMVGAVVLGFGP